MRFASQDSLFSYCVGCRVATILQAFNLSVFLRKMWSNWSNVFSLNVKYLLTDNFNWNQITTFQFVVLFLEKTKRFYKFTPSFIIPLWIKVRKDRDVNSSINKYVTNENIKLPNHSQTNTFLVYYSIHITLHIKLYEYVDHIFNLCSNQCTFFSFVKIFFLIELYIKKPKKINLLLYATVVFK